jgi:hypothetical protein
VVPPQLFTDECERRESAPWLPGADSHGFTKARAP